MPIGIIIVFFLIVVFVSASVKILNEYERGVVFRLGRTLDEPKGPGLILLFPFIDRLVKISTRTITMDIEPQDVITKDNVSVKVNAVLYFRVVNPTNAVINIENYLYATSQLAQTHLRSILGQHSLDQLLSERDTINDKIQTILDLQTDPWGVKVVSVEIKHIDLPVDMQRAMAREAESERERRAKIIAAEGEMQAAGKLREAADTLSGNKTSLQLRYLQTLADIASEGSKYIVFPLPMEFFDALSEKIRKKD